MPTDAFQRWATLLAMPFFFLSASTLPSTRAAAIGTAAVTTQQGTIKPTLVAQRSRIQRVRFAPGADSATIKTSVLNGTRDLYLLGAQKGQTMSD